MPFVETRDHTRLHVKDQGTGRPVVLIHGWPANGDMWEYQSQSLLEAGFRVIAYDRRGFGRSDRPWQGFDYDTFADDLEAVLEGTGARDVTLVGFSMGGGEVARYMSRHEGRNVVGTVLVGAVTPLVVKREDNPHGVDRSFFEDTMLPGLRADRPAFLANFTRAFYGQGFIKKAVSPEILQWAQDMAFQADAHATYACVRAFAYTDFRSDMAAMTRPTLIVHGTADQIVPIEPTARVAHRLAPGSELVEYEDAPHGLFVTEKERLTQDLVTFLRR